MRPRLCRTLFVLALSSRRHSRPVVAGSLLPPSDGICCGLRVAVVEDLRERREQGIAGTGVWLWHLNPNRDRGGNTVGLDAGGSDLRSRPVCSAGERCGAGLFGGTGERTGGSRGGAFRKT